MTNPGSIQIFSELTSLLRSVNQNENQTIKTFRFYIRTTCPELSPGLRIKTGF